jgi:Protein of unknown function (DUF4058)
MNPYLELPVLWAEFHSRLIVALSDALTPQLQPNYYVAVETRSYLDADGADLLVGIPDAVVLPATTQPAAVQSIIATQVRPQRVRLPIAD